MKLVIIESPYAGTSEANRWYLWSCLRDSLMRGEAPFASHALYTLPTVLDDSIQEERDKGIQAGFSWRCVACLTAVYTDLGISPGMEEGIIHAKAIGCPIEHRTLEQWKGYADANGKP